MIGRPFRCHCTSCGLVWHVLRFRVCPRCGAWRVAANMEPPNVGVQTTLYGGKGHVGKGGADGGKGHVGKGEAGGGKDGNAIGNGGSEPSTTDNIPQLNIYLNDTYDGTSGRCLDRPRPPWERTAPGWMYSVAPSTPPRRQRASRSRSRARSRS